MTTLDRDASISAQPQRRAGVWVVQGTELEDRMGQIELTQLSAVTPARVYDRGERLFRPGDVSDGFFVMLSGRVKLAVPGHVTGERVLAFCGEGELFGCVTGEGGLHRSEAVSLVNDTQVMTVSHDQFYAVAQQVPGVAVAVSRVQARRVQALEEQLERTQLPVQARLAYTLLDLCARFGLPGSALGDGAVELHLEFHHDEFASMSGTTRARATQAMSAWRSMGLVSGTRGAYQVNVTGLQSLVELLEAEQLK